MNLNKQKFPRKSSNRILQQKQITLLLHSQAIEEFPWFKTLLQGKVDEGRPFFTFEDAASLSPDKQLFLQDSLPDLENASSNEWKCETNDIQEDGGENKDNWVHCALCNTRNRWVFYIINTVNEIRLNVGSTCITYFGINTAGMSMAALRREATKLRWVNEVNQKVPSVKRLAAGWDDQLNSYPILIPKADDETYRTLGRKFRACFEKYIDPKNEHGADDLNLTVQELKQILEDSERLKEQMATYSKAHEHDQFVATREIVRWVQRLDSTKSQLILKLLKNDGYITAPTAHRIAEPQFMKSMVPSLNSVLTNVGLQVRSVESDRPGYLLATVEKPVIELDISHRDLLLAVGGAVFENQHGIEFSDVINHCTIANHASREIVRANFAKVLVNHGYSEPSLTGDFESIREDFDEWVLVEQSSQRIIILEKLSSILDKYVNRTMSEEQFIRNFLGPQVPRYSRDEFQERYTNRLRNR